MSASLGFATKQYAFPVKHVNKPFTPLNIEIGEVTLNKNNDDISNKSKFNWMNFLIFLNLSIALSHFGVLLFIIFQEFRFPLTFFYTTPKASILTDINCIYDYGNIFLNTSMSFCQNQELTLSGDNVPPVECNNIFASNITFPGVTNTESPILQAYELTRFGKNDQSVEYIDNIGKILAKTTLLIIESVTIVAHILYTFVFYRMRKENGCNKPITHWFISNGGIPLRWIEYALTASLMSLFIANIANLFEFFGILSITLSVFSQMFFGIIVEYLASQGFSYEPLVIIYIPALSIFIGTWAPIIQSLATSVFKLSCKTHTTDSLFSCSSPTCFGQEIPITFFSLALFLLFCTFPIVLIYKVYVLGGWFSYVDNVITRGIELITCQPFDKLNDICYPLYITLRSIMRIVNFILFIFFGCILAWYRFFTYIFAPFLPSKLLLEKTFPITSIETLFLCEFFYAICSATSKIFLALFFTISFAPRTW